MTSARQLDREIAVALAGRATATHRRARRRPEEETNTGEFGPGTDPPRRSELDIGSASSGYKPLYWKDVVSHYKKDAPLRERDNESALRASIRVGHAADAHTPFTWIDWPEPIDARGAIAFAQKLVEDGEQYARVIARAWRPSARRGRDDRGVNYTLASFQLEE